MEVLWRRGEASVNDVIEDLPRGRDLAYTTVKTVMTRLAEKGYLRRRSRAKAYVYEATRTREEFLRAASEEVLRGVLVDFGEPVLAHLIGSVPGLDRETLDRLQARIEEHRRRKGQR